jgi:hypothetical protein
MFGGFVENYRGTSQSVKRVTEEKRWETFTASRLVNE